MHSEYGIIFIGGGLSSVLAAYTWLKRGYPKPILIIEQNTHLCGNHTWSFNQTDIIPEGWQILAPLVDASWQKYQVKFPKLTRVLNLAYHSISSEGLASKITRFALETNLLTILTGQKATFIEKGNWNTKPILQLENGQKYTAEWIIQATGLPQNYLNTAYQKFVGIEVELKKSAGVAFPIIMDATIPQKDGFRFMYVLPFTDNRLLIEDTYYSWNANLSPQNTLSEIETYTKNNHWEISQIIRREQGALPIPLHQPKPYLQNSRVLPLGMCADLFHATTGYSLAVNYNFIWEMYKYLDEKNLNLQWHKKRCEFYNSMRFYRIMNRFLFIAGKTNKRYRFLESFYQRHSDEVIARFYAGKSTFQDKMRIFSGKAPFLPSWYMFKSLMGQRKEENI